jgi:hypothetical protein
MDVRFQGAPGNQYFVSYTSVDEDEEGWTSQYFRVGSFPVVTLSSSLDDESPDAVITSTEPIEPAVERNLLDDLTYTIDGRPARCRSDDPPIFGPGSPMTIVYLDCDAAPTGSAISLSLGPDFAPPGRRVFNWSGTTPPRWEFAAGSAEAMERPRVTPALSRLDAEARSM